MNNRRNYFEAWKLYLRPYFNEDEELNFLSTVQMLFDFISLDDFYNNYRPLTCEEEWLNNILRNRIDGYELSSIIYRLHTYLEYFLKLRKHLTELDHDAAPFVIGELMDEIFKLQEENDRLKKEIKKNGKTD